MQLLAKIFLILFIFKNVKGEFEFCDNGNKECNANDLMISDIESNDLNTLVKQAIQYFKDFNEKYDNRINGISTDIDNIKKSLQMDSLQPSDCLNSVEKSSTQDIETTTEKPPGLYDNLWVVIQRRQDGSESFFVNWNYYKRGFGNQFREFFIGLEKLHYLTDSGPHELLIQLADFNGNLKYALYDEFVVGNESERYQLKKLGSYSGNAGDYMRIHEGMYFSTRDRDNDASPNLHCAKLFQGGWWYNNCLTSHLNGPFRTRYVISNVGITWGKYDEMQIKIVQMMIRSKR
ncbi:ryncolin-4-like [Calliphora vicina]|uniref:ryncolin-4-like n=1 Tax=Calliphora vicina TaxID=7373 RepID=UPI00325BE13F